jgi:endoglucanase
MKAVRNGDRLMRSSTLVGISLNRNWQDGNSACPILPIPGGDTFASKFYSARSAITRSFVRARRIFMALNLYLVLSGFISAFLLPNILQEQVLRAGVVGVQGTKLLRDGRPWIPHGFYQIAFEVAPGDLARADHPFWATAYNHYTPQEYKDMRAAGADSVRLQIAQVAADPQNNLFDRGFLDKAIAAIHAARDAGLTVIVSVQDETHVQGDKPIDLPDDGTRRVWKQIAPLFAQDQGVLFELMNEPRPEPNPANWRRWATAMNQTIQTIRQLGAHNVVVADGLRVGQVIDGAPLLNDSQVAYASRPYALHSEGQKRQVWDGKFGNFSRRAPVILTEWLSGGYFCDADPCIDIGLSSIPSAAQDRP